MNSFNSLQSFNIKNYRRKYPFSIPSGKTRIIDNSDHYLVYFDTSGSINFIFDVSAEFTIVGGGTGGGGAGAVEYTGLSPGGGGHVINTNGKRNLVKGSYTITIGSGGEGRDENTGLLGGNSGIRYPNGIDISTNNTTYAGSGFSTVTFHGYGTASGSITPANNGNSALNNSLNGSTTNNNNTNTRKTGGAGAGALSLLSTTNVLSYSNNRGGTGGNATLNLGGKGGQGHLGVDNRYYGSGGGGAGGKTSGSTNQGTVNAIVNGGLGGNPINDPSNNEYYDETKPSGNGTGMNESGKTTIKLGSGGGDNTGDGAGGGISILTGGGSIVNFYVFNGGSGVVIFKIYKT
jgi:hypothetical protein